MANRQTIFVVDNERGLVAHESKSLRECESYVSNCHYIWGHKLSRYEIVIGVAEMEIHRARRQWQK